MYGFAGKKCGISKYLLWYLNNNMAQKFQQWILNL